MWLFHHLFSLLTFMRSNVCKLNEGFMCGYSPLGALILGSIKYLDSHDALRPPSAPFFSNAMGQRPQSASVQCQALLGGSPEGTVLASHMQGVKRISSGYGDGFRIHRSQYLLQNSNQVFVVPSQFCPVPGASHRSGVLATISKTVDSRVNTIFIKLTRGQREKVNWRSNSQVERKVDC